MFDIPEKFVKNLERLDNYYVLRKDKDAIIVGTKIKFLEYREFLGNVFQPRTQNIDKELPVFFLLTLEKNLLEITKEFTKRKLPRLSLDKKQISFSIDNIKQLLDDFVTDKFKY